MLDSSVFGLLLFLFGFFLGVSCYKMYLLDRSHWTFIADLYTADNVELLPDCEVRKGWRFSLTGSVGNYSLVKVEGDIGPEIIKVDLGDISRFSTGPDMYMRMHGEQFEVDTVVKTPTIPGKYVSKWELRNSSGERIRGSGYFYFTFTVK